MLNLGGGRDNKAAANFSFGHVTTKTWAYSGVFGFFRKKNLSQNLFPTSPLKSIFENTMGNPFLNTFCDDQNSIFFLYIYNY